MSSRKTTRGASRTTNTGGRKTTSNKSTTRATKTNKSTSNKKTQSGQLDSLRLVVRLEPGNDSYRTTMSSHGPGRVAHVGRPTKEEQRSRGSAVASRRSFSTFNRNDEPTPGWFGAARDATKKVERNVERTAHDAADSLTGLVKDTVSNMSTSITGAVNKMDKEVQRNIKEPSERFFQNINQMDQKSKSFDKNQPFNRQTTSHQTPHPTFNPTGPAGSKPLATHPARNPNLDNTRSFATKATPTSSSQQSSNPNKSYRTEVQRDTFGRVVLPSSTANPGMIKEFGRQQLDTSSIDRNLDHSFRKTSNQQQSNRFNEAQTTSGGANWQQREDHHQQSANDRNQSKKQNKQNQQQQGYQYNPNPNMMSNDDMTRRRFSTKPFDHPTSPTTDTIHSINDHLKRHDGSNKQHQPQSTRNAGYQQQQQSTSQRSGSYQPHTTSGAGTSTSNRKSSAFDTQKRNVSHPKDQESESYQNTNNIVNKTKLNPIYMDNIDDDVKAGVDLTNDKGRQSVAELTRNASTISQTVQHGNTTSFRNQSPPNSTSPGRVTQPATDPSRTADSSGTGSRQPPTQAPFNSDRRPFTTSSSRGNKQNRDDYSSSSDSDNMHLTSKKGRDDDSLNKLHNDMYKRANEYNRTHHENIGQREGNRFSDSNMRGQKQQPNQQRTSNASRDEERSVNKMNRSNKSDHKM